MAVVRLRNPLKDLADGRGEHETAAATVGDALRELEAAHPALQGWILDERGELRRHINVYVNGEQGHEASPLSERDRVEVLPAISGGAR